MKAADRKDESLLRVADEGDFEKKYASTCPVREAGQEMLKGLGEAWENRFSN